MKQYIEELVKVLKSTGDVFIEGGTSKNFKVKLRTKKDVQVNGIFDELNTRMNEAVIGDSGYFIDHFSFSINRGVEDIDITVEFKVITTKSEVSDLIITKQNG